MNSSYSSKVYKISAVEGANGRVLSSVSVWVALITGKIFKFPLMEKYLNFH
jgi:hypothetical protein